MRLTVDQIIPRALLALGLVALAMPISNFFLKRQSIEVTGGVPEFKPVSKMMQNKCVDCHTPGMYARPIYENFPYANKLIKDDIEAAQKKIVFTRENLSGERPFTKLEAARIFAVVDNNDMPIPPYKIMHWDAILTENDRAAVEKWLTAQFQPGAPTKAN